MRFIHSLHRAPTAPVDKPAKGLVLVAIGLGLFLFLQIALVLWVYLKQWRF